MVATLYNKGKIALVKLMVSSFLSKEKNNNTIRLTTTWNKSSLLEINSFKLMGR